MIKNILTPQDRERGAFQKSEMELLALNLEFEAARSPKSGLGLATLAEKIRDLVRGGETDATG